MTADLRCPPCLLLFVFLLSCSFLVCSSLFVIRCFCFILPSCFFLLPTSMYLPTLRCCLAFSLRFCYSLLFVFVFSRFFLHLLYICCIPSFYLPSFIQTSCFILSPHSIQHVFARSEVQHRSGFTQPCSGVISGAWCPSDKGQENGTNWQHKHKHI